MTIASNSNPCIYKTKMSTTRISGAHAAPYDPHMGHQFYSGYLWIKKGDNFMENYEGDRAPESAGRRGET